MCTTASWSWLKFKTLHALSVSVCFFVPAFYTQKYYLKYPNMHLDNFYCSEKTSLRASLHTVSGRQDLKNTKANSLCLYVFSFLVLFILLWKHCSNITILQSKYYQGTCIIFTGSCLPEYLHCGNRFWNAQKCNSLMRQFKPHSLLHWLTEQKLLRKCEASGFLFYFKVNVGNFSKKSRFGLKIVSPLGKILRKEAHW